jgi:hypothetical protein
VKHIKDFDEQLREKTKFVTLIDRLKTGLAKIESSDDERYQ